jgi:hypothetical protein
MAACWALEPAPTRSPLSCAALLPPALLFPPLSLEAPHAARGRVLARAAERTTVRVVVLSFNSVPFDWRRPGFDPGQVSSNDEDARHGRWTDPGTSVNGR